MEITKTSFQFLFANTIRALFKQSAKEFDNQDIKITPEQNYLLRILTSQEESIQSDLAEIMQKDKSAIMRHIDQLEKMAYVVRVNDAIDRRKKHIVITELGAEILKKCEQIISNLSEKNMETISDDEMETFKKVLIKLKENAER
ncbi:MarR family winged helix-turn-helix transcriptional regulator [Arcicella rosea]|uniref:DNA-binding MarR family transcriptional regulator n=1 Tax=Arcicella rosea TaxID=502909 RepID=A0A841ES02_9BACT|nr:MarR family transcriptional regulator [Arcicella rosea]MBB6003458.1 DNA-binding MarR family transcriptional regulator [Arcicella rosea]